MIKLTLIFNKIRGGIQKILAGAKNKKTKKSEVVNKNQVKSII